MTQQQPGRRKPRALCLANERSVGRMVSEVLVLERYQTDLTYTASHAFSILREHNENTVVLIDNLHSFTEGQAFLADLIQDVDLWARTDVLSMAAGVNCDRLRAKYGPAIDAHLAMPFTADELLATIEALEVCSLPNPKPLGPRPPALVLGHDGAVSRVIAEILRLVEYQVDLVRTAAEAEAIVERTESKRIILMDYPHNNPEARTLLDRVRKHPNMRSRLRLVGFSAVGGEYRDRITLELDLDEHIILPFATDDFVACIGHLWRELNRCE